MSGVTHDTLFVGYAPSFHGVSDWRATFRHVTPTGKGSVIRRTVWEHAKESNRRLIVDVGEYRNLADTYRAIEVTMREAEVRYHSGPASLGPRSLVYPQEKPWSIFATRANLVIWGVSNGPEQLEVEPLLTPMLGDLDAAKATDMDRHLGFSRVPAPDDAPAGAICLAFQPEFTLGEFAWLKFQATGAALERGEDPKTLVVLPETSGHAIEVIGWVTEPGRKPYMGRYAVTPTAA